MQRLANLILIFAILFALLIIAPAFLSDRFLFYPLMQNGDVLDLFTPLILIPLYWLLFQINSQGSPNQKEMLLFLCFATLWIQGQGMHLVANSIGHQIQPNSSQEIKQLTNFYDERLSHYIWHLGLVGLSALLIYRQWHNPFVLQSSELKLEIMAGMIHGVTFFIDIIESATTILGIPWVMGVVLFVVIWGRQYLRQQPIMAFFLVSYSLACLLFIGWGIYWGGFPEFSQVGIID